MTRTEKQRQAPEELPNPDWAKVSKKLSNDLVDALTKQRWPIMISGSVGTGKSYAMACVYQAWMINPERPKSVLWYDVETLVTQITECRTSKSKSISVRYSNGRTSEQFEGNFYKKITDAALVCFDDFGVSTPSESKFAILKRVLDLRNKKPTIITTNHSHEEFEQIYDERVYSRAFSGPIVWAKGEDRRFEWRKQA